MKKLFFSLLLGVAALAVSAGEKSVYTNDPGVLPARAQTFLTKHFSTLSVRQIKVENNLFGREYEVRMAGGCEIDFDSKGEWTQVDCGRTAVPSDVVPDRIARYVAEHYPQLFVVSIDRDSDKYEVELSDETDLEFTLRGDFLRID